MPMSENINKVRKTVWARSGGRAQGWLDLGSYTQWLAECLKTRQSSTITDRSLAHAHLLHELPQLSNATDYTALRTCGSSLFVWELPLVKNYTQKSLGTLPYI